MVLLTSSQMRLNLSVPFQVQHEFQIHFAGLTVENLLEQFTLARYTGLEKPGRFERFIYDSSLKHSPVRGGQGQGQGQIPAQQGHFRKPSYSGSEASVTSGQVPGFDTGQGSQIQQQPKRTGSFSRQLFRQRGNFRNEFFDDSS